VNNVVADCREWVQYVVERERNERMWGAKENILYLQQARTLTEVGAASGRLRSVLVHIVSC
jgi:hypothetical protein